MLTGFRDFLMRGNVVDLAVGIVIGAAFGTVVNALVADLLTPLIAALFTAPDFSHMVITVNGSAIKYGDFLNAIISFVIAAASIYFFVVTPMNKMMAKFKKPEAAAGPTADQKLLMEIRDALLKR
jgi:large conductance mechanosensitive channel